MHSDHHADPLAQVFRFDEGGALLRSILENAAVGMVLMPFDGSRRYCNRAFADMLGYTIEEASALTLEALNLPEAVPGARMQFDALVAGRTDSYRAERRYKRKDGSLLWVLVSATSLLDPATGKASLVIQQVTNIDAQKHAEAELAQIESRWNFALEGARQGVWDHDITRGTAFFSRMWRVMRGMDPDEEVDASTEAWMARVHPDDRERLLDITGRQNSGEIEANSFEYRERHRDGHWMWILSRGKPVEWMPDGSVKRSIGTDTDITVLKHAEAQLAEEKERLKVTLQSIGDGVISTDASRHVTFINPAAEAMTGWPLALAMGRRIEEVFVIFNEANSLLAANPVAECLARKTTFAIDEDLVLIGRADDLRDIRASASPLRTAQGAIIGSVLIFQDITQSRTLQKQLAHSATHDTLTGLHNRAAFDRVLADISDRARSEKRQHALCFIDLDRFKPINDSAGHAAGDAVLQEVAQVIRQNCRSQDFAARIGGDEFVVLMSDCALDNARKLAQRLVDAVAAIAFEFDGRPYRVGASIGIAPVADRPTSAILLTAEADAACYAAKAQGRGRVVVFNDGIAKDVAAQMA